MLLRLLFLASTWSLGAFTGLYDVTTIYRIDEPAGEIEFDESPMSAEIHARTNALGLPFLVAGNVVEPEVGVDVPRCVALRLSDVRCDWDLDNWDWTVWEEAPLLDTGDWSELQVTGLPSKYLPLDAALFIRLNGMVHNQSYIHIVFTPNRAYIQNQEQFYYLQISRLHQSFFHRCDNGVFERFTRFKDVDEHIISIHCDRLANITQQMEKWTFGKVNAENYLLVEMIDNGTVRLWNTINKKRVPMFSWEDPDPIPINYFSIRTDEAGNAQVSATNYGKGQVLSMSENVNVATITSPPVSMLSDTICVSVVYYTRQSTTPTVLIVEADDHQPVHLGELNITGDGWKIDRFTATLPESMVEEEVRVKIKSVNNKGDLFIQRIAGCNSDDAEDIATISVLGGFSTPSERVAYTVAVRPASGDKSPLNHNLVGDCENGGLIYSDDKCACPAGFTGDHCQTGCGANRYGRDCGGLCSLRDQACRGLTLCTPHVGCFCAPGFKGYHCNQTCEGRQYGAGCTQRCNNCAGKCDIYTGVCTSVCKPGYFPPYCKAVYSYTRFAPQVNTSQYGKITVTPDVDSILGEGKPAFFQVQLKLSQSQSWTPSHTQAISLTDRTVQNVVIKNLHHGVRYDVRVVLIDQDLNSYEGGLIPHKQILTNCFIPEDYDYKLRVETTDTTITAFWQYEPEEAYRCPVVNYEVSWLEGWRWLSRNVTTTTATLTNKLPVTQYKLKVRALLSSDYAPFSQVASVHTKKQAPGPVSDIKLASANSSSLTLTWTPPADKHSYHLSYLVLYQCRKYAACERECKHGGEAHVTEPQVTLQALLPLSQYLITVAAVDGVSGQNVSVLFATKHDAPSEEPRASTQKPTVTDNSITVFWQPVEVCSGFFQEYRYQLFQENNLYSALIIDTAKEPSAVFENLEAKQSYKVKIFVVSSGGWNQDTFLWINATTRATAPEAVQELAVYKTSRQMLGVRWAPPNRVFGDLDKFLLTYKAADKKEKVEVEPSHCTIWLSWYCHTLTNLSSDTKYIVTVQARNKEVSDWGPIGVSVEATTNEKAPEKPSYLEVSNLTANSFLLSWGYPLRANGILRSFLVTVAETERVESDQCCKLFPNIEVQVNAEQQSYETEIVGVNPASTYAVSVTGQTVVLGAPESLIVYTRPPHLLVRDIPSVDLPYGQVVEWLPQSQQLLGQGSSPNYSFLIRGNLLVLLVSEETTPKDSGAGDSQLHSQIKSALGSNFIALKDYTGNDFLEVEIASTYIGLFGGQSTWKLEQSQRYQLAAVQVVKYFKSFSVDIILSKPFQLIAPTLPTPLPDDDDDD